VRRALLVFLLFAGCAAPHSPPAPAGPTFEFTVEVDHDHGDPSQHNASIGLDLVSFVDATTLLGEELGRLSDIQFHGDLATVTVNGRAGASSGGFLLLDVRDAAHVRLLGRYRSGSEDNWYTKFSPDGRFVFLTANGNTDANSAAGALQEDLRSETIAGPARGLQVVDVTSPDAPRLAAFYPAPVRVVNVAPWTGRDGTVWVFASIIQDRAARPAIGGQASTLNHVAVLRFDPSTPRLEEVAQWSPSEVVGGQTFPHDLFVARNPLTDQDILYVAYWDAGGYLVDVSDPRRPTTLGRVTALDAADHVHTFKAGDELIAGKLFAVLAPETFAAEPTGTYRALDVSDPARPMEVARWTLAPNPTNAEALLWSPHEFTVSGGHVYASQYHGGAWILSLPDLHPAAAWQRSVGDPGRTGDWAVDIETFVPHAGVAYAIDMGSGILVLRPSP